MGIDFGKKLKGAEELGLTQSIIFGDSKEGNDKNDVNYVELSRLVPYKKNPFKLYEGNKLEEMIRSITTYGILQPILVRKVDDEKYEILAGHNRFNVARLLAEHDDKFKKVPVRVLENISDEEAELIVSETNMQQRSISDLLPSEKAFVIATYYNAEKKQGRRTDLIEKVNNIINDGNNIELMTGQEKAKSEFNLSAVSIAKYNRVNTLTDEVKEKLDNGEIDVDTSYNLSFRGAEEQHLILSYMDEKKVKLNKKKSETIKKLDIITKEKLDNVFIANKEGKKDSIESLVKKHFPGKTKKEMMDLLEKILSEYNELN